MAHGTTTTFFIVDVWYATVYHATMTSMTSEHGMRQKVI
jgi:hypothetical protein